jgi:serine phosphatase RsbU (regulator of sigma subunit)
MNKSIFRQFMKALFLGLLPLVLLMLWFSHVYFQRQKEVATENFFRTGLQQVFLREKAYRDYYDNFTAAAIRELRRFKKNTGRKFEATLANIPSVSQLERAYEQQNLEQLRDDFSRYLQLNYKSEINALQKRLLQKFPLLDADWFEVQYINHLLLLQFLNITGRFADEDYDKMAVIIRGSEKENPSGMFSQIFVMLFVRRFFQKIQMEATFINPVMSIAGLNIDVNSPSFQTVSMFSVNYALMIDGLTGGEEERRDFFDILYKTLHEKRNNWVVVDKKEQYHAYLSMNLSLEQLFQRVVSQYQMDSPVQGEITGMEGDENVFPDNFSYQLVAAGERKTIIERLSESAFSPQLNELSAGSAAFTTTTELSFLNPVSNQPDGVIIEADFLADELRKRGISKFSWRDLSGRLFYGLALFDAEFGKFIHILGIPEEELLRPVMRHLHFLGSILLLFSIVISALLFIGTRSITAPVSRLAKLVNEASESLCEIGIEEFNPFYIELEMVRRSFHSKVRDLAYQFSLQQELINLQKYLFAQSDKEQVLVYVRELFQRLFNLELIGFYDGRPDFAAKQEANRTETGLFDEQVRLFFRKLELEREFADSVSERREFELASNIQKSLMSHNLQDAGVATFYQAARFLGGDFYDVRSSDNYGVYLIADVSGKGLPAALFAATVKACFDAIWRLRVEDSVDKKDFQPGLGEIFQKINDYTLKNHRKGFFCTAFVCYLDRHEMKLYYASGGHNKMILVRNQEIIHLSAKGFPLGFIDGLYEELNIDVQIGDMVFLYTDGITEAEDEAKNLFGMERLHEILISLKNHSVEEVGRAVIDGLQAFTKGAEQSDDLTYVVFKV